MQFTCQRPGWLQWGRCWGLQVAQRRCRVSAVGLLNLALAVLLTGCASPGQRMDEFAAGAGLQHLQLAGAGFRLSAYRNSTHGKRLHIYLAGDGTPWRNRYTIAADPTPREPLALQLMARDPAPGLYLSRPCYHGHQHDPGCSPLLWTLARYGPEVVTSMAAALHTYLLDHPHAGLVFIGYSGGATLAMLLAPRFPQTRAVLTVAGNLDPDAWAARHGYSPLSGSLNPTRRPPLPVSIRQWHLAGGRDRIVPAALIKTAAAHQHCAQVIVFPDYDHHCCWLAHWPALLRQFVIAPHGHGRLRHFWSVPAAGPAAAPAGCGK